MTDETCKSKAAYKTIHEALRVAAIVNRRKKAKATGHAPAYAYRCKECGMYHLTGRKTHRVLKRAVDIPLKDEEL